MIICVQFCVKCCRRKEPRVLANQVQGHSKARIREKKGENQTRCEKRRRKNSPPNENAFRAKHQSCRILILSKRSTTTSNSRQESVSGFSVALLRSSDDVLSVLFGCLCCVRLPRNKSAAFVIMMKATNVNTNKIFSGSKLREKAFFTFLLFLLGSPSSNLLLFASVFSFLWHQMFFSFDASLSLSHSTLPSKASSRLFLLCLPTWNVYGFPPNLSYSISFAMRFLLSICYFFSVKGAQNESPWILTVNSKRSGLKVSLFQPRGLFELYSYFHALFHQPRKRIASGCYDFSIDWILNKQQSMEKSGRFSCFWVKHITLNRRGMDFWCNMNQNVLCSA